MARINHEAARLGRLVDDPRPGRGATFTIQIPSYTRNPGEPT
jgi:hypothetical protein